MKRKPTIQDRIPPDLLDYLESNEESKPARSLTTKKPTIQDRIPPDLLNFLESNTDGKQQTPVQSTGTKKTPSASEKFTKNENIQLSSQTDNIEYLQVQKPVGSGYRYFQVNQTGDVEYCGEEYAPDTYAVPSDVTVHPIVVYLVTGDSVIIRDFDMKIKRLPKGSFFYLQQTQFKINSEPIFFEYDKFSFTHVKRVTFAVIALLCKMTNSPVPTTWQQNSYYSSVLRAMCNAKRKWKLEEHPEHNQLESGLYDDWYSRDELTLFFVEVILATTKDVDVRAARKRVLDSLIYKGQDISSNLPEGSLIKEFLFSKP